MSETNSPSESLSGTSPGREHHSPRNRARLVLISVLALGAILAIISFLFLRIGLENFKTEGSTMRPTLAAGDYLLVNRFSFLPAKRGEVIVFHYPVDPKRDFVKRVIGVPGDRISINEGTVLVNGAALSEPYITARDTSTMSERKIGRKEYFVLGDNRPGSTDSRRGWNVPEENIIGKVWFVYWPSSHWGPLNNIVSYFRWRPYWETVA